jgi:natural product biosynthesis luciferase-like monooxygenase protein
MDLSLFYFANDSSEFSQDRYRLLLDGARFADERGFTAVWTPERHFHPFGGLYPNPAVTGAAIAAITRRVGIRAGSVVAPLHHPARIAEEWSVVDNISGGRVGISFASGWHASDFALRPENYRQRRELTVAYCDDVRRLWRGESIEAVDGVGNTCELKVFPPPIQPEVPVWITSGGSVETFRSAGRAGAGLLTHLLGQEPGELGEKIAEYRKAAAESDRAAHEEWRGHVVLMVHTYLAPTEDEAKAVVREPLDRYLRSSLNLLLGSSADGSARIDAAQLSPDDIDFIVGRSFDRYFGNGLLGTIDKARASVEKLNATGVDELACLIDFGVGSKTVLESLELLDQLRASVQ